MGGYEHPRPAGISFAAAAFYCGLVGGICSALMVIWTWTAQSNLDISNPPKPNLILEIVNTLVTLTALTCGVLGVVFGAVAGSRAKKEGNKPASHGRIGLITGILALVLLVANFLLALFLSVNRTFRAPIEFKRKYQTVERLSAAAEPSLPPASGRKDQPTPRLHHARSSLR